MDIFPSIIVVFSIFYSQIFNRKMKHKKTIISLNTANSYIDRVSKTPSGILR